MSESLKIKAAALAAAIFLGGIAVVGITARSSGEQSATEASLKPEVIHKRKVKTVRLPSVVSAAPPASAAIPVSAPASTPAPVSSRTSPGGSAGDDEGERERDEHEGGGEDD